MTRAVRLDLPWTKPPLTANQRMHWAKRAKLTREVRSTAAILARRHKAPTTDYLVVTLHYQPRDRRRRDSLNLYPIVKACVDGLVDAGLVPDDDTTYVSTPEPIIHPPNGKPALWLELEYPNGARGVDSRQKGDDE